MPFPTEVSPPGSIICCDLHVCQWAKRLWWAVAHTPFLGGSIHSVASLLGESRWQRAQNADPLNRPLDKRLAEHSADVEQYRSTNPCGTATRKRVPALCLKRKSIGTHRLCASLVPLLYSLQSRYAWFLCPIRQPCAASAPLELLYPLFLMSGGILWPTVPVTCSAFFEKNLPFNCAHGSRKTG